MKERGGGREGDEGGEVEEWECEVRIDRGRKWRNKGTEGWMGKEGEVLWKTKWEKNEG